MRIFLIFILFFLFTTTYSQKVNLTPLSFKKTFELEKAPTSKVLKDYTQFSESPFTKIPKGFTLSDASTFYKFDTLNCSLFIKKREDIDSLVYYRDCEDGRWCYDKVVFYPYNQKKSYNSIENRKWYRNLFRHIDDCCDSLVDTDTSALIYKNEFVIDPGLFLIDKNLPYSIVSDSYISIGEYNEFVSYVKDSSIRTYLAYEFPERFYVNYSKKLNVNNILNKDTKYSLKDPVLKPLVSQFFTPDHERYRGINEWDKRKMEYYFKPLEPSNLYTFERCSVCGNYFKDDVCVNGIKRCDIPGLNCSFEEVEKLAHSKNISFQYLQDKHKRQEEKLSGMKINVYPDSLVWLWKSPKDKKFNYSIWASENYFKAEKFSTMPVVGINYWQAEAFLDWKTKKHNEELSRKKSKYRVFYTFPLPDEIQNALSVPKIQIQSIDFRNYVITNSEYEEFVTYVIDSIVTELKFQDYRTSGGYKSALKIERALKVPTYDNDGQMRNTDEWRNNKKAYLGYFNKLPVELKKDSLFYTFEDLLVPKNEQGYWNYDGFDTRKIYFRYTWRYYNRDTLFERRDLDLSGSQNHVYSFADKSEFNILDAILIYPGYDVKDWSLSDVWDNEFKKVNFFKYCDSLGIQRFLPDSLNPESPNNFGRQRWERDSLYTFKLKLYDFKSNPDAPITAITYEQAKAYYHWKNEVPYIPTKEEWSLIKQGINPYKETELEVPGPFFRYVIRVYPVRESEKP